MKKRAILIILLMIALFGIYKINLKDKILMKIYKIDYLDCVEKYSNEYDVDKYLILAIIKAESNFDEKAISKKKAIGLMQLLQDTAEEIAPKIDIEVNEQNIFEPELNINLGTKYISILLQKYKNVGLAVAAYNAGSGNVDNWIEEKILLSDGSNIENVPFAETNTYVRKILRDYEIYRKLYN